jgi:chorismate mutase
LLIETHPDPEAAWSDAAQQVTPAQLRNILATLIVREEDTHDMSGLEQLEYLRQLMDTLDAEIIDLVARRMELSGQIGSLKKMCNMTVFQPSRWSDIVESIGNRGIMQGLTKEFVTEMYEKIHHESIRIQLSVMEDTSKEIKK